MNFTQFWHKLVFYPKAFFTEDFDGDKSPFLLFTVLIYGMSNAIDRAEKNFLKADLRDNFYIPELFYDWTGYWIFVFVYGTFSGWLFYYLGGWFYNLRIKWCGGTSDIVKARFLYLYPSFIPAFIAVLSTTIYMLDSPVPYNPDAEMTNGEVIGLVLFLVAMFYSIRVSFVGVTTTTDVSKGKAKVWFLFLPIIFYCLAYSSMIAMFVYMAKNDLF